MGTRFGGDAVRIDRLEVSAYTVPTDFPESDGTYAWEHTTLVLVEATAGGKTGLGYTYADTATAALIRDSLAGGGPGPRRDGGPRRLGGDGRTRSATSAGRASPRWPSPPSTRRSGTSRRGCSTCRW